MGNLATSWSAIKSSYNAILDRAKTAELDRDHFKTKLEQAGRDNADLQTKLDAAQAIASQFDAADQAAATEIIKSGAGKTSAANPPAAPPASEPVETTQDNTGGNG